MAVLAVIATKEYAMPNQEQSHDAIPRKDADRPAPDVRPQNTAGALGDHAQAGKSKDRRGKRPSDERPLAPGVDKQQRPQQGGANQEPSAQDYRGPGPGKVGLTSSKQPNLVSPSGVNQRDHGAAEDKPMGDGGVNFDDDDMVHPRGKVTGAGRTWDEKKPSDAGDLGTPNVGMSGRNGPSDRGGPRTR